MWFKIYFWIYTLSTVLGIAILLRYAPFGLVDILSILISLLFILSLYSYIYKKKFLEKKYWLLLFWFTIFLFLEEMIGHFVLPKGYLQNIFLIFSSNIPLDPATRLLGWVFSIPVIYSLHKLSKK